MPKLSREEYIEQAYLFRGMNHRLDESDPVQVVMKHLRDEILATTKLPMAIDYLLAELSHAGSMAVAMHRLGHYFEPFQAFIMDAAEDEKGRFDIKRALTVLEHESRFRSENEDPAAMFFFQFDTICQNFLDYDKGLVAMSNDSTYNTEWKKWLLNTRHKLGMVSIADLIYIASEHYVKQQQQQSDRSGSEMQLPEAILFGEKEGRIALANRNKEPQYLFAALQRQLGYPAVPKPKRTSTTEELVPKLLQQVQRLEVRLKLLEDETRESGIDLSKFYRKD